MTLTKDQILVDYPDCRHGWIFRKLLRGSCARDLVESLGENPEACSVPWGFYHSHHLPGLHSGRPLCDVRIWGFSYKLADERLLLVRLRSDAQAPFSLTFFCGVPWTGQPVRPAAPWRFHLPNVFGWLLGLPALLAVLAWAAWTLHSAP